MEDLISRYVQWSLANPRKLTLLYVVTIAVASVVMWFLAGPIGVAILVVPNLVLMGWACVRWARMRRAAR